jgi:type IX secretion system PorP/SprF family membrane protein
MRYTLVTLIVIAVFGCSFMQGQEKQFSYYQFTPLTVNPANAGAFSGSYRISGIFSDKQAAITPRPFRTFTLSFDAPIIRGFRKQDWIGVGAELDVIGNSGAFIGVGNNEDDGLNSGTFQSFTSFKPGLSYHLSLDKKQSNILTLGVNMATISRNFARLSQYDGRVFPQTGIKDQDIETFNQGPSSGGGGSQQNTNNRVNYQSYKNLGIGLLYNARRKDSDLRLGISISGITSAKIGFLRGVDSEKRQFSLNFHGAYDLAINKRTNIIPGFYYYSQGNANAFNVNTHVWYQIDPEKEFKGGAGLGMRNFRAVCIYLGAEIKDIKVGLAYDIDISTASNWSNTVGGFELCASYIGKIYKKPKPKAVIFCPRL